MTRPVRPASNRDEPDRVVIRDKRKVDPVTGELRSAGGSAPPSEPAAESDQAPMVEASLLDERTADLQRVQAEYANYRKRADRDRLAAGDVAVSRVLAEMLPVLDDIDRARTHDDLTGALKAVADHLDVIFSKLGLQAFGEVGDPFDPSRHEAALHTESDDVTEATCTLVMRRGYQHGERLLRPAMVGVTEPLSTPTTNTTQTSDSVAARTADATPTSEESTERGAEGAGDGDTGPEAKGEPGAKGA